MARRIRTFRYVPKAFGNETDPDPVVYEIVPPTYGALQELQAVFAESVQAGDSLPAHDDLVRIFGERIASVENYEDASGSPITSGRDLVERGETAFVLEAITGIGESAKPSESLSERQSSQSE